VVALAVGMVVLLELEQLEVRVVVALVVMMALLQVSQQLLILVQEVEDRQVQAHPLVLAVMAVLVL
jgi:hypothetical protein